MATAKKLPSGSWRCQVYDYTDENGKRHYKSFTSTDQSAKGKLEAERMAANYATEKELRSHCALRYGPNQGQKRPHCTLEAKPDFRPFF